MDRIIPRPRLATAWLGGCSGCHMSFLDLDERLIDLAAISPTFATRPSRTSKSFRRIIDIALVEGAVANEDHLRDGTLSDSLACTRTLGLRSGDCAVTGKCHRLAQPLPAGGRARTRRLPPMRHRLGEFLLRQ